MNSFLELVAEIFEVEPKKITMGTVFRELDGFSSLAGFSLLVMMEDEYNVQITMDAFRKCHTVGDLYEKCVKG